MKRRGLVPSSPSLHGGGSHHPDVEAGGRCSPDAAAGSALVHDDADVQRQRKKFPPSKPPLAGKKAPTHRASSSAAGESAGDVPVGTLLQKIAAAILSDLDDETLQREDTETILIIITLLKEAIAGVIMAFLLVSLVLLADHVFALRLPTARNFRRASFAVMNDAETLRSFEENSGLKFLHLDELRSMRDEIARAANKTRLAEGILEQRAAEGAAQKKEYDRIRPKIERAKERLGFERFCEKCMFATWATCQDRVNWLEKHKVPKYQAMMAVMHTKSCVLTDREIEKEKMIDRMMEEVERIAEDWEVYGGEYNPDGDWTSGTSCQDRADYLSARFGYPLIKARAMTMVETNQCRNSFSGATADGKKNYDGFCDGCLWDRDEGVN